MRPDRYTEGAFGIIVEENRAEVQILIHNPETEAYLRERNIHPTQKFTKRRDGKTVLTMTVRGTTELRNWVLGFGPWLEVLKPTALRQELRACYEQLPATIRSKTPKKQLPIRLNWLRGIAFPLTVLFDRRTGFQPVGTGFTVCHWSLYIMNARSHLSSRQSQAPAGDEGSNAERFAWAVEQRIASRRSFGCASG